MPTKTLMPDNSRRVQTMAVFSAAGLLSGVLTACSLTYVSVLGVLVGSIFGTAMAICLSWRQRRWDSLRFIALIASSMMGYFGAIWSSTALTYVLRLLHIASDENVSSDFSPGKFSLAGFVGAFIVMLAVLLLFYQEKGWRTPAKAAALALPGAILGLVSAITSNAIQHVIAHWIQPSTGWVVKPENFYSAYLIWQTGMALVLSGLLPANAPHSLSTPTDSSPDSQNLSIGGKIFVAFMLASASYLGIVEMREIYNEAHPQHRIAKIEESGCGHLKPASSFRAA